MPYHVCLSKLVVNSVGNRVQRMQGNLIWVDDVSGGVRPSPGAASTELVGASGSTAYSAASNGAASGDGCAPPTSHQPSLNHDEAGTILLELARRFSYKGLIGWGSEPGPKGRPPAQSST